MPVNALLMRGHGETLLVDAGSGPADVLWPGAAELDGALDDAGVRRDEIDTVVLTHVDFDHAGGALDGTWPDNLRAAFARAVVPAVDAGEARELTVGRPLFAAYEGRLELAGDGAEFRPGLRLVSAPGHRAGHCVLLVGDELVYAADVLHHVAHVEHPDWAGRFDADRETALATRRGWLERLAESGTPAAFAHVETRGRVVPGHRWLPD